MFPKWVRKNSSFWRQTNQKHLKVNKENFDWIARENLWFIILMTHLITVGQNRRDLSSTFFIAINTKSSYLTNKHPQKFLTVTKELPSSGNISLICNRAVRSWISSSVSSSSLMVNSLKSWICFSCIESGNISENRANIPAKDEDWERDNSWTKSRWSKSSWETSRKYSKSSCETKIFNKRVIFYFFYGK